MAGMIKGYMNVSASCSADSEWEKFWAILTGSAIELHEGPTGESQSNGIKMVPKRSLVLENGVDLRPAALETGKVLAFKLVRNDNLMAVIEPQNIEDMGNWVSNIFKIIQEANLKAPMVRSAITKSPPHQAQTLNPEVTSPTMPQAEPQPEQREEPKPRPRSRSLHENEDDHRKPPITLHRSVSVRDLAKMFETKKTEPKVPEHKTRLERSRSMSSLNVPPTSPKPTEGLFEEPRVRPGLTRSDSISCYRGPYLEQDGEKEILNQIANPYLVRLKIRKRENTMANLKTAIAEIMDNKKLLEDELTTAQIATDITAGELDLTHGKGLKPSQVRQDWLESRNKKLQLQITAEEDRMEMLSKHVEELQNEIDELKAKIPSAPIESEPKHPVHTEPVQKEPLEKEGPLSPVQPEEPIPDVVHRAVPIFTADPEDSDDDMGKPEWARRAKRISRVWTALVQDDRLP